MVQNDERIKRYQAIEKVINSNKILKQKNKQIKDYSKTISECKRDSKTKVYRASTL